METTDQRVLPTSLNKKVASERVGGQSQAAASTTPPQSHRVILFGKVGDGKSSVGNMLLRGSLDGPFDVSNNPAVQSSQQLREEANDEWTVVEAPGFDDFVTTGYSCKRRLQDLTRKPETTCVCYVKKASQRSLIDEACWKVLQEIVGDQRHKVLLVFTSSNADWLKEYLTQIDSTYGPGYPRIAVDFASRSIYNVVEAALAVQRQAGKEALEKELRSIVARQEALEKSRDEDRPPPKTLSELLTLEDKGELWL